MGVEKGGQKATLCQAENLLRKKNMYVDTGKRRITQSAFFLHISWKQVQGNKSDTCGVSHMALTRKLTSLGGKLIEACLTGLFFLK